MFYDHTQVDDLLNCPNCSGRYDTPLLLPCYRTICQRCINKHSKDNQFTCPYCSDTVHHIPEKGYAINDAVNSMLKLKPVDVHRAEMYRRITDLLKLIQISINDLDNIETNVKANLFEYFALIRKEVSSSAENVIEHTIKYRNRLLGEIDYMEKQSADYFKDLCDGSLLKLKKKCNQKRKEWQNVIEARSNEKSSTDSKMSSIISEASLMNEQLNETKVFIQNTITSRKLVFNQAEPLTLTSDASLVGQLDFNDDVLEMIDHRLKINFLNDLVKVKICRLEPDVVKQTSYLIPMIYQRLLKVIKASYDEFSNYEMSVRDLEGKEMATSLDILDARVNTVAAHANYVLVGLTDKKTNREMIKIYNSSLQLITKTFIDSPCESFYLNDTYIYAKLTTPNHPFILKFTYQLEAQPIFQNLKRSNELFVSFVVDKLVYISSGTQRLYFKDKCFSRLKIFEEDSGDLLCSIHLNNLRDCSIRIDASLHNSLNDQFVCLNKSEKWLRCYDIKTDMANESGLLIPQLIAENFLIENIKNISNFYLTKDGYYVFVDHLNDSVYLY